jgi:hypothetical protein
MRALTCEPNDLLCLVCEPRYRGKKPLLIDGMLEAWPARTRWRRSSLLASHGAKTVATGDGANIVLTGGKQGYASVRARIFFMGGRFGQFISLA